MTLRVIDCNNTTVKVVSDTATVICIHSLQTEWCTFGRCIPDDLQCNSKGLRATTLMWLLMRRLQNITGTKKFSGSISHPRKFTSSDLQWRHFQSCSSTEWKIEIDLTLSLKLLCSSPCFAFAIKGGSSKASYTLHMTYTHKIDLP